MLSDENMNLDSWRLNRAKALREDNTIIDTLCDTLLRLQNRCAELEEKLRLADHNLPQK